MDSTWEEVERMAQAASAQDAKIANKYSPDVIARWQRLFNYTPVEAMQLIKQQREDGIYPHFVDRAVGYLEFGHKLETRSISDDTLSLFPIRLWVHTLLRLCSYT
jgi:hypothetical protein